MTPGSTDWYEILYSHCSTDYISEVTKSLVEIDSVNPPGRTREAVEVLSDHLTELEPHQIKQLERSDGKTNLIARFGNPRGPRLIWNGHLDVVPPGESNRWSDPPFELHRSEGRLYGRGTTDMKGAFGSLLGALHALRAADVELGGELVLQAVSDEETMGPDGTQYLLEQQSFEAMGAICGEPTGLTPMVAAKGLQWWSIVARGESCHASIPDRGHNAIDALSDLVRELHDLPHRARHPLLGRPTLAVTTMEGGSKTNIIPDRAELTLDRRLIPGETPEQVEEEIRGAIDTLRDRHPEVTFEPTLLRSSRPSEVDSEHDFVRLCTGVIERVTGSRPSPGGMHGATDARLLINQAGIPTVILGPGQIEQAHIVDEFVEVEQLEQAALVYGGLLCRSLGTS